MHKYNLGFISDHDIFEHVKDTVQLYRTSIDLKEFNANIIDPIKLTFDSKVYGKSLKEVVESECIRQIDKSNQNHIGYFHQNLFKYAPGWEVPEKGFDVVNEHEHIFAELKNKHNFSLPRTADLMFIKMQDKILHDKKATCFLVEESGAPDLDEEWEYKGYCHARIRKVSLEVFYGIVFGHTSVYKNLCKTLPYIIDDVYKYTSSTAKGKISS
ncbi:MAG: Eco47II family restriction endonuclease [Bacteroidales bacterium]|nr:Eco47II family restriction endonuclease [Bacteroidales bacterium]